MGRSSGVKRAIYGSRFHPVTRERRTFLAILAGLGVLGGLLVLERLVIWPVVQRMVAGISAPSAPVEPPASFDPPLDAAGVYVLFTELGTARTGGEPGVLSVTTPGALVLPTGRVVADDIYFFSLVPFERALPPGSHPVHLLELESPSFGERVAAAMIRVAPGDPVSWELAVVPGADPTTLGPDEFFGFAVDSGTAAFTSAEAVAKLEGVLAGDWYQRQIEEQMFPSAEEHRVWADIVVDEQAGLNVIGFDSGFGDGDYPSYFGLDADGNPLVLLANFEIIDDPAGS